MELRVADSTSSWALALREPDWALMVAIPADCPVAKPADTVAMFVFEDDQVTQEFRFCVVPSLKLPTALNCRLEPGATSPLAGVSEIDVRVAELTVNVLDPAAEAPA